MDANSTAKVEIYYLQEDWSVLKKVFRDTFTVTPVAIFGLIPFGLAYVVSLVFFVVRVKREIAKAEVYYLQEDWSVLKKVFRDTFTVTPVAIFGVIPFGLVYVVSLVSFVVKVTIK